MNIYTYLHEFTEYKEGNLFWKKCPRQGVSIDSKVGKTIKIIKDIRWQ